MIKVGTKAIMELPYNWLMFGVVFITLLMSAVSIYMYFLKDDGVRGKTVYTFNQEVAVYTQIIDEAIISPIMLDSSLVSSEMITEKREIIGAYLIEPVKSNNVILKSQFVLPPSDELIHHTRIISIPVSAAAAWNGEIAPGEVISIWIDPQDQGGHEQGIQIVPKALVLKAQKTESMQRTVVRTTYFVTIIVPETHFQAVLISALSQPIMFVPTLP